MEGPGHPILAHGSNLLDPKSQTKTICYQPRIYKLEGTIRDVFGFQNQKGEGLRRF